MIKRSSVALLLLGSGFCALVYQTAWLREFRLIFGASTAASAAVLAIFMGGLGLGGLLLGRRADLSRNPLALYAKLEFAISLAAAVTPLLVAVVRYVYVFAGGSHALGLFAGTVIRLLMATLVLAIPTLLMGGTLPAAARAASSEDDPTRRNLALLYAANTIGAVLGAFLSTFFLLEMFGTRNTLWLACLINLLVAITARSLSRGHEMEAAPEGSEPPAAAVSESARISPQFVLISAAVAGFAFLLMEIIWYRMLSPLLGGSTFTFGLILSVALLGIGLGGAAYAWFASNRPVTLNDFALTCACEAAFIGIPFALGDRLAIFAMLLRPLGTIGFSGHVLGWALLTFVVIFPAAFIAGIQFPVLIALLGRGREKVGRHVGQAYLWNTAGAIGGSLAGGFGLLPLLSATGTWRLVVVLLCGLAAWAYVLYVRSSSSGFTLSSPLVTLATVLLVFATGPTAAWRHSAIGAGRPREYQASRNSIKDWLRHYRRTIFWERDGVESSVALTNENGVAFLIGGKVDGNARGDAGTQVMSGMLGAILHDNPKSAMVIGLGTGSTAGWLGAVPSIERVDVVELEPAVLHVAEVCTPVNQDVLRNRRVRIEIGDARELLLTTSSRYDIIFSEPSNPYRAGIASLFTKEFYEASSRRLHPNGIFLQWLQAYEVDARTVRTIYATISAVFPHVETWQTSFGDLVLVARETPLRHDASRLRKRIAMEPFRSALLNTWRVTDLEGFFAHFIANQSFPQILREAGDELNTDDRTSIEFGFARNVGRREGFNMMELSSVAIERGAGSPQLEGTLNGRLLEERRISMMVAAGVPPAIPPSLDPEQKARADAKLAYLRREYTTALLAWQKQSKPPSDLTELLLLAESLSENGNRSALPFIEHLRRFQPAEADVTLARLLLRQGKHAEAATALERALIAYRTNPWPLPRVMAQAFDLLNPIAAGDPSGRLHDQLSRALEKPFSVSLFEEARLTRGLELAKGAPPGPCNDRVMKFLAGLEPHFPWQGKLLSSRANCYDARNSPERFRAGSEFLEFLGEEPAVLDEGLPPVKPVTGPGKM